MSAYSDKIQKELEGLLNNSEGVMTRSIGKRITVCYMSGLIDTAQLNLHVISRIPNEDDVESLDSLREMITIADCQRVDQLKDGIEQLLSGFAIVTLAGSESCLLVNVVNIPSRSPGNAETETLIYGPQIAFTESMEKNIALLRSYITNPELVQESIQVGSETRTIVNLLYMNNAGALPYVELLRKRIASHPIKGFVGSALFLQLIQDKKYSIFPELSLTERPDRSAQALLEGKVVIMAEGNSQAIIGPNSFIDFFQSFEDRYTSWGIGLFNRILRIFGSIISVYLTPMYVAALTYHYEVIPMTLLEPLISSRSRVPFPPLIESLILELSIELLREAGARLPTKVGQTMGIVGGIVIGQAAVQAGFTSNILIMLVALAALGSFTTPNYMMSASIRIIRFPMLFMAGAYGLIGISVTSAFLIIHLLRMTSYGKPYLYPFYPPSARDIKNAMLLDDPSQFQYKTDLTSTKGKAVNRFKANWFKKDIDE